MRGSTYIIYYAVVYAKKFHTLNLRGDMLRNPTPYWAQSATGLSMGFD